MPRHLSGHINTATEIGFYHNNKFSTKYINKTILQNKCDKHAIVVYAYSAIINMPNKIFNMRVNMCIYIYAYIYIYMCVCVRVCVCVRCVCVYVCY